MDLPGPEPDLERIAGDLADIERALDRLGDGSYWTDEVTGETIPDDVLAVDPTARRARPAPPVPPAPADDSTPDDQGAADLRSPDSTPDA